MRGPYSGTGWNHAGSTWRVFAVLAGASPLNISRPADRAIQSDERVLDPTSRCCAHTVTAWVPFRCIFGMETRRHIPDRLGAFFPAHQTHMVFVRSTSRLQGCKDDGANERDFLSRVILLPHCVILTGVRLSMGSLGARGGCGDARVRERAWLSADDAYCFIATTCDGDMLSIGLLGFLSDGLS